MCQLYTIMLLNYINIIRQSIMACNTNGPKEGPYRQWFVALKKTKMHLCVWPIWHIQGVGFCAIMQMIWYNMYNVLEVLIRITSWAATGNVPTK